MAKLQWVTLAGALAITISFSIFWHVVLFEKQYLSLGVYTRMDDPIYEFGLLAWLMESTAFVLIYFQTKWAHQGFFGSLKYSWMMGVFGAASTLAGAAAKIQISDLSLWFLLTGGFIFLHFTFMGIMLGMVHNPAVAHQSNA